MVGGNVGIGNAPRENFGTKCGWAADWRESVFWALKHWTLPQGAEARHEELAARLPEATRPLLRQIEAMQDAAAQQAGAWDGAERSLNARLVDAEGRLHPAAPRKCRDFTLSHEWAVIMR